MSTKTASGQLLHSTRLEEGGTGVPVTLVLGKALRAPRGWELGIQSKSCAFTLLTCMMTTPYNDVATVATALS